MDLFFTSNYCALLSRSEQGEPKVFEYCSEYGKIVHYYIERKITDTVNGEEFCDIITPYGYGGPVLLEIYAKESVFSLLRDYEDAWQKFCTQSRYVSEFLRFHLFENSFYRDNIYKGDRIFVSNNVICDTNLEIDSIWNSINRKVRKNVNQAKEFGLTCVIDNSSVYIDEFFKIYYETMNRRDAKSFYYFPRDFFNSITEKLPENSLFFHVIKDNKIISSELVLYSTDYAYSFLGGTLSEYFCFRPNDFLKWRIIEWAQEKKIKKFILGGGYTYDDGIYKYKKYFSNVEDSAFYVGKRIFLPDIYEKLVNQRVTGDTLNLSTSFFPLYRA